MNLIIVGADTGADPSWCEGVRGFPAPSAAVLDMERKELAEAAEQLRRRAQKKEWEEKWLELDMRVWDSLVPMVSTNNHGVDAVVG